MKRRDTRRVRPRDLDVTASVAPVEATFSLERDHLKSGTTGRTTTPFRVSHIKMFFNQRSLKQAKTRIASIFSNPRDRLRLCVEIMGDRYIEAVQNYAAGRFNTTGSVADLMRDFPHDGMPAWVEVGGKDWRGANYIVEYREGVRDKAFIEAQDLKYLWGLILTAPDPHQALQKIRTDLDPARPHHQNLQRELTTKALQAMSYHKSLHPELTIEALQAMCREEAEIAERTARVQAYRLREEMERAQEQMRREEAVRVAQAQEQKRREEKQRRREEVARNPQIRKTDSIRISEGSYKGDVIFGEPDGLGVLSSGRHYSKGEDCEEFGQWEGGQKHGVMVLWDKSNRFGQFTLYLYHASYAESVGKNITRSKNYCYC